MRRTQIYLTTEQRERIMSRARDARVSRAEIIRRILDAALGIGDDGTERVVAIDATAGILPDSPDWPDWLASVRGGVSADERLKRLGT